MRIPIVAGGAAALLAVVAPQAFAAEGAPLRARDGVVVAWQAGSKSAVVVTTDNRVYVVHSIRRYAPGTRVRVQGVKWGTTGLGVKWGVAPAGVKWGIKIAKNGTHQSGLVRLGTARTMALRGTVVKRFGTRGVTVSVRGAVVTIPVARGAVWLPGGKLTNAGAVGELGSQSVFTMRVDSRGRVVVTGARQVAPARNGGAVPFAGTITAVDLTNGTITVRASSNKLLPLDLTITVPVSVDLAKYAVGNQIAGTVVPSVTGSKELFLTGISRNETFAAADNPTTSVTATPPNAADLSAVGLLRANWKAGFDATPKKFTAQGDGLYTSAAVQLASAERAVARSDSRIAKDRVETFIDLVERGNDPIARIDPAFQAEMLTQARALRDQIASHIPAG